MRRTSVTRFRRGAVAAGISSLLILFKTLSADDSATNGATTVPPDSAVSLVDRGTQDFSDGQIDRALQEVSLALQLDPHSALGYDLRASIYIQQKLWDRAERDIVAADRIAPDVAYKYKLGEIKFLQKAYDDAQPRFAALQGDPRLGDLAAYKAFLCDLFGGHEAAAARDLAAMPAQDQRPSYYFSHAAWALYHGHPAEGNQWFGQARPHFDDGTIQLYIAGLLEVRRFQPPIVSFVAKDGRKFEKAHVFPETDGLRVSAPSGWITLPLDELPDDLSGFPDDMRMQIQRARVTAAAAAQPTSLLSFTTTSGKAYNQVRWSVESAGLDVLTTDGWITVPFNQLPADLSSFPPDLQQKIAAQRVSSADQDQRDYPVSFTTPNGKRYDDVKATLRPSAVVVLTSDGLVTIPFRDLPHDLSPFPADWRPKIEAGRQQPDSPDVALVSFTTRDGRHFDDVRAALETSGLRVITPQGAVMIAFDQLPSELAAFPEAWRGIIADRRQDALKLADYSAATTDLYPPHARDCNFGTCLALQDGQLVVGANGAAYIYAGTRLLARLCSRADATLTGDEITSVAISGETIATGTPRGVDVWLHSERGWILQATLSVPGGATTVSLDGDNLLVIGDGKGSAANTISHFIRQGKTWALVPRTAQQEDDALSADRYGNGGMVRGGEALIGVPDWSNASYLKGTAAQSGRTYVERYDGSAWIEDAVLQPNHAPTGANQFGASVALSGDLAAISSANHDAIDYKPHHGSVYLFRHAVAGWKQEAVLKAPVPTDDSGFGCAPLALWRETLAIGNATAKAQVDNVVLDTGKKTNQAGTINNAGAIYIFEGPAWEATIPDPDPTDSLDRRGSPDRFGTCLALEGNTLAVGAPGKNGGAGIVYLWQRRQDRWQLEAELKGFHPQTDFSY